MNFHQELQRSMNLPELEEKEDLQTTFGDDMIM